jgi:rod shape-determining protein MreC
MKFSQTRNKTLFLFIVIIIFLSLSFFQKSTKNFFYSISEPFQKNLWRIGANVYDFFGGIFQGNNLKKENEELKLKIQELEAEKAFLKELKTENEFLKKSLDVGLEKEFKLILAEIVGNGVSADILIIDKGSKDGILKDLPVITEQKILVGKILEANENYSKIMLITNKESSFNGKIQENEVEGVVKGIGNLNMYLDLLPKDKEIKEGDTVITSSLDKIFPKGILVGKVKEVKKNDLEPFQQAEISPSFNIKELKNLFVITSLK